MNNRNQWWIRALIVLLALVFPVKAFCQNASIQEVSAKGANGAWKVGFHVGNCFTEKMEEAVQTGIKTAFTFYLHLEQKRKWWKDKKLASVQFQHIIQYDPVRGEYQVTLGERKTTLVTRNFAEAKGWMSRVEGLEIRPSSDSDSGPPSHLRIKAELDAVKLPLHLESLFFFVSLWDFETDWHIEPLAH